MYTFEVWLGDGWKVFENKSYIPSVGTIIDAQTTRSDKGYLGHRQRFLHN